MSEPPHPAYREAHPLPYVVVHWTHLVSMIALAFTGFFIHYPFAPLKMGVFRQVHFAFMYVVLAALVARVWYAFAGRSAIELGSRETARDYHNFGPQESNRGQLLETLKYYLFLRETHPASGKYNPLQKSAYVAIGVLLLVQAYTGFALYGPAQSAPVVGAFLGFGTDLLGGLMAVRVLHYLLMWAFIVITLAHTYLAFTQDLPGVPLMFLWRETPPPSDTAERTGA